MNSKSQSEIILHPKSKWLDSKIKYQYSRRSSLEYSKVFRGNLIKNTTSWARRSVDNLKPKEQVKIKHEPLKETLVSNILSESFNKNQIDFLNRGLSPGCGKCCNIETTTKNFDNGQYGVEKMLEKIHREVTAPVEALYSVFI